MNAAVSLHLNSPANNMTPQEGRPLFSIVERMQEARKSKRLLPLYIEHSSAKDSKNEIKLQRARE